MRKSRLAQVGLFALAFLAALISGARSEQPPQERMGKVVTRVYFLPFEIQTSVPVTMDDIEKSSPYIIWFVKGEKNPFAKEHPFVPRLRQLLQSRRTTYKINDSLIRLKVDFDNETFYVDQKGRVLEKNSERTFELAGWQMREIAKSMGYFSGVVDVNASEEVSLPR